METVVSVPSLESSTLWIPDPVSVAFTLTLKVPLPFVYPVSV